MNTIKFIDLFQHPHLIPVKIIRIMNRYEKKYGDDMDYSDTENMLTEFQKKGYTFDYYLDNMPYGLRPLGVELNQLQGYEDL